jgi:hypothetical protein
LVPYQIVGTDTDLHLLLTGLTPNQTWHDLYCKCVISYDTAMSRAKHPDRISRKKE